MPGRCSPLGDDTPADIADPLALTIGWDDPKLAVVEGLDEHGGPRLVSTPLELAR